MEHVSIIDSIYGVEVIRLQEIENPRGNVLPMLRSDSACFNQFGEIYFSEIKPGQIKAWKRHYEMTQLFAVPVGQVRLIIFDDREQSPTYNQVGKFQLGRPHSYNLIKVPPGLCYGFKNIQQHHAMIANVTDMPHKPDEYENMAVDDPSMPNVW